MRYLVVILAGMVLAFIVVSLARASTMPVSVVQFQTRDVINQRLHFIHSNRHVTTVRCTTEIPGKEWFCVVHLVRWIDPLYYEVLLKGGEFSWDLQQ